MSSREDVVARQRKEIKALEGEKRATMKKTKSTAGKGKKGKELLASVEAEFDTKLKEMQQKHEKELSELDRGDSVDETTNTEAAGTEEATAAAEETIVQKKEENVDDEEAQRQKKIEQKREKARKKREKQREKEKQRELDIQKANREAGPSLKQIEMDQIQAQLTPLGYRVCQVQADGHCLYRAIAQQLNNNNNNTTTTNDDDTNNTNAYDYQQIRALCAQSLKDNEDEFAPFCEYEDGDFQQYVERVRNSADWGGHVELRAISTALKRNIVIYQQQSSREPLLIQPHENNTGGEDEPIRLSYHLHYYALGEHYNHVMKMASSSQ